MVDQLAAAAVVASDTAFDPEATFALVVEMTGYLAYRPVVELEMTWPYPERSDLLM